MLVALESPQYIRLGYYRHDAPDNPPATTFPMVRLPAISVPRSRTLRSDNILFYHPGYPTPVNILFSLPRVDQSPSEPDLFGVDAQIALLACQIVASNVFATGYLASDEKGIRRADTGPDSVLTQSEYWFFVEGDDEYPVVPSFRDWQFPHDRLPSFWPLRAAESLSTSNRCPVTNASYALTEAHIIPKEESEWFLINGMHRYGNGRYDIDDPSNIVTLRSDVHICLDRRVFAFVPKPDKHQVQEFVLHVLDPRYADFAASYQNRTVHLSDVVSQEYLFARFAWAVIHLVKPFIVGGVDRRIAKFSRAKTGSDEGSGKGLPKAKIELLEGPSLMALYGGGCSRSASPRKRKASSPKDEWDFDESVEESAGEASDHDWYAEHLELVVER
ncbi:hypothetical protein CEP51_016103 [Fusarium floridanum]|uniref:HNH nuclease domain-containing protein n=1 Tax=Fusarium floridanum TaxID=1325733 RepID=A0A428NWW8_9HYPO|nr:hypothetical protein CEP51_016103 [Fusarium floridanum]